MNMTRVYISQNTANNLQYLSPLEDAMEYHRTKDALHVKQIFRHKNINNH